MAIRANQLFRFVEFAMIKTCRIVTPEAERQMHSDAA